MKYLYFLTAICLTWTFTFGNLLQWNEIEKSSFARLASRNERPIISVQVIDYNENGIQIFAYFHRFRDQKTNQLLSNITVERIQLEGTVSVSGFCGNPNGGLDDVMVGKVFADMYSPSNNSSSNGIPIMIPQALDEKTHFFGEQNE